MSGIIAIDFDGTIVEDAFPGIGELKPGAAEVLKRLKAEGYYLILWTCRSGKRLAEAAQFLGEHGIRFDKYNESCPANIELYSGEDTRKVYADLYIDDRGIYRPMPKWEDLYEMIHEYYLPTYADKVAMEGFL